jgi:hypothetical protein
MKPARRTHITYANVMSTIAVVLVVAGGATAIAAVVLAKNSVKSRHIARGAVKTSDLGRNAATGAKVKEATLGTVPSATRADSAATAGSADTANSAATAGSAATADNASLLDGVDSTGYARGYTAASAAFSATLPVSVPGVGTFALRCDDFGTLDETDDKVRFDTNPTLGSGGYENGLISANAAPGDPPAVSVISGDASSGFFAAGSNRTTITYSLAAPGVSRQMILHGGGETLAGDSCRGHLQALLLG